MGGRRSLVEGACPGLRLLVTAALVAGTRGAPRESFFGGVSSYLDVLDERDAARLAPHYESLVARYAAELAAEFRASERFSRLTREGAQTVVCKGQIGRVEASMLYVAIRIERPRRVVEVGALCGSSTRWILAALAKNGDGGTLETFDLYDYAPRFVPRAVEVENWTFRQRDINAYIAENAARGDALLGATDLFFMDALHHNKFAQIYTKQILARMRQRVLVFVHDIFSPFMLPHYKSCERNMTVETLAEETACIDHVAAKFAKAHRGIDTFYGTTQPGGEGIELMSWLARTGRSNGLVTFSPYAAPAFAKLVFAAFRDNGLLFSQINNPAVFFEIRGA